MMKSPVFILLLLVLAVTTLIVYFLIMRFNDGVFTYTFDDAYIHMAYSKHIVLNGIWGVTPYEFSSSSSSPLLTVLLTAAYYLTGVNDHTLLIFNFISAILLVYTLFYILKKSGINSYVIFAIVTFIILLAPFSLHIFSGMEHLLHTLLSLLFLYFSAEILSGNENKRTPEIYLVLLSSLLVGIRYEGLILVGIAAVLFLLKKKYLYSVLIVLAGLIPVILYGIKSVSNGSYFFPNTIMIKSKVAVFLSGHLLSIIFDIIYDAMVHNFKVSIIFFSSLAIWVIFLKRKKFWNFYSLILFFFLSMTILQVIFGNITHWRYEVSILVIGMTVLSMSLYELLSWNNFVLLKKRKRTVVFIMTVICIGVLFQGVRYIKKSVFASRNIYEQQYQMAMFLKEYYTGGSIAANDIGAINYYADIHCLDLVGLGSYEVTKETVDRTFSTESMRRIAGEKNVRIALLYHDWFDHFGGLPAEWIKAGEWKVTDNYILGGDTVTFYAVDPGELENLKNNLENFSEKLPKRVLVSIRKTE